MSEREIKQGVLMIVGVILLVGILILMVDYVRQLGEPVRTYGQEHQDVFDAHERCQDAGYDGVRGWECFNYTIEEKIARGIE